MVGERGSIGSIGSIGGIGSSPRLLYPEGEHAYQQLYSSQLTTARRDERGTQLHYPLYSRLTIRKKGHLQPVCSAMPLPATVHNKWLPPMLPPFGWGIWGGGGAAW